MKRIFLQIAVLAASWMTPAMATEVWATEGLGEVCFPSARDKKPLTLGKVDAFLRKCKGEVTLVFQADKNIIVEEYGGVTVERSKKYELYLGKLGDIIRKYPDLRINLKIVDNDYLLSVSGFKDCKALVSVTLPKSVVCVENDAFRNCVNLETINFEGEMPQIVNKGIASFGGYQEVGNDFVNVPGNGISMTALWGCSKMQKANEKNVGVINGKEFFYMDDEMTDIEIPGRFADDVLCGNGLWMNQRLQSVRIASGGKMIGAEIYNYNDGENMMWTTKPFTDCQNLKRIEIAEGYEYVSGFADMDNLEYVSIPESVTGMGCIMNCPKLKRINIPNHLSIDRETHKVTMPWIRECDQIESINIPSNIEHFNEGTFANCTSLKEIVIPEGVIRIENEMFKNCTNLRSVILPSTLREIGEYAFVNCASLRSIVLPHGLEEIGQYAFSGCENLTDIEIPSRVTSIGKGAFWACGSLKKGGDKNTITISGRNLVYYPADVVLELENNEVPEGMFDGFTILRSVVIPDNVTLIGNNAFRRCLSLSKVAFPKDFRMVYPEEDMISYGPEGPFAGCESLRVLDFRNVVLKDALQFDFVDTIVIRGDRYLGESDFFFGNLVNNSDVDDNGNERRFKSVRQSFIKNNIKVYVADNLVDRYIEKMREINELNKKIREEIKDEYFSGEDLFQYEFLPLSGYKSGERRE